MTMNDFLLARIIEETSMVRAAIADGGPAWDADVLDAAGPRGGGALLDAWRPSRILAECEAKYRIVTELQEAIAYYRTLPFVNAGGVTGLEKAVKLLALPYADHPDYRDEWRP